MNRGSSNHPRGSSKSAGIKSEVVCSDYVICQSHTRKKHRVVSSSASSHFNEFVIQGANLQKGHKVPMFIDCKHKPIIYF